MKAFVTTILVLLLNVSWGRTQITWQEHLISGNFAQAWHVSTADLDLDGDIDILGAAYGANQLAWWENNGQQPPSFTFHSVDDDIGGPSSIEASDLDSDGDIDLIASAFEADAILWYDNNGNMSFTGHLLNETFNGARSVFPADINGDGHIDILAAASIANKIGWWENSGSQPPSFGYHLINGSFNGATSVCADFIDEDGDLDILGSASYANDIAWWSNNGNQSFTMMLVDSDFGGAHSIFTADLDRDGDMDILGAAHDADIIKWWENDGNGVFTGHIIDNNFDGAYCVYAADINADSHMDVLGAASDINAITWWENNGSQNFTEHEIDVNFEGAMSVAAADLDGDNDLDVVGAAFDGDEIIWWEQEGSPVTGEGDSLWSNHFGGLYSDPARDIIQTADGGYVMVGYEKSFPVPGPHDQDMWLVKTGPSGDSLWSRSYGATYDQEAKSVIQENDGGFILAGYTYTVDLTSDVYVVRTNSAGDTMWTRSYGGDGSQVGLSLIKNSEGNYVIAGQTGPGEDGPWDMLLLKISPYGDLIWSRTYGGAGWDKAYSVIEKTGGGYLLAGETAFGVGLQDLWLLETNASGDSINSHTYGGAYNDYGQCVIITDDGYVVAGASASDSSQASFDVYLVKVDLNLDSIWSETYGGNDEDWAYCVIADPDSFVVAGYTKSFGSGPRDMYLLEVDPDGNLLWEETYGGSQEEKCYSVIKNNDNDGDYVLGGWSWSFSMGMADFWIIRVEGDNGIPPYAVEPFNPNMPVEYALQRPHPNPFNPATTLTYTLPAAARVKLSIFDIRGRLVATLVDGYREAGVQEVYWDAAGLPSGIYGARLEAGGRSAAQKLVLLK